MADLLKLFDLVPRDVPMILICAILFVALWKVLGRVLFDPYLNLIEAREAATQGAQGLSHDKLKQADTLLEEYNSKLSDHRQRLIQDKLSKTLAAKAEADKLIHKTEDEARAKLSATKEEIKQQEIRARQDLNQQAAALAEIIVRKLKTPTTDIERRS